MEKTKWHSEELQKEKAPEALDKEEYPDTTGQACDDDDNDEDDPLTGKSIVVEKRVGNVAKSSFQHHLSLKKKACIVKIDNCHYTIVANTPDTKPQAEKERAKPEKTCTNPAMCKLRSGIQREVDKKKRAESPTFISQESEMENVFKKLKELHAKVSRGQAVNVAELKKTLEFAIGVADRTHFVHQSSAELTKDNVFESEAVPCQVRDWLTMTFTRSSTLGKEETLERSRFKSVANAIRAGISVEKLLKTNIPKNEISKIVLHHMTKIDDWTFDIFELNEGTQKSQGFRHVVRTLMSKYEFTNKFKINTNTLENFIVVVEEGYRKYTNPYHNDLHAADVTQTVNCVLTQTELKSYMTDLEIFSILFAAIIHDFEHTGTTNTFHINTQSDLAMLYNDRAVLENYHVSQIFKRMRQDQNINIISNLNQAEYNEFRYSVVDIVLATDMSYHFQQLKLLKAASSTPEILSMLQLACTVVHFSDISHPAKAWNTHTQWTKRLLEEFFIQGDREIELNLPVSPLCDRHNTMVAESQIGFIDFIVSPTLNQIFEVIPVVISLRAEDFGGEIKKHLHEGLVKFREEVEQSMLRNKSKWAEESKKH